MTGSITPTKSEQTKKSLPEHQTQSLDGAGLEQTVSPLDLQSALGSLETARPETILRLQRLAGNRSVTGLFQRKLLVGPANDSYEQEAERVSQQVVSIPAPVSVQRQEEEEEEPLQAMPLVQRQEEEEEVQTQRIQRQEDEEEIQTLPVQRQEDEEEIQTHRIQRQEDEEEVQTHRLQRQEEEEEIQTKRGPGESFAAGANFESRLAEQQGRGQPLPGDTRSFMEDRFGVDFSGVRLHTDGEAEQLNRAVSAQAFTHGQDIYMGEGKSDLASSDGQKLIAHELTHVVQQSGGAIRDEGQVQRFAGSMPIAEEMQRDAPAGFKLFGTSTYGKIIAAVRIYHKLGTDKYAAQLEQIGKIEKMIEAWEDIHGKAVIVDIPKGSDKAEAKRRNSLAELKTRLRIEKAGVTEQTAGNLDLGAGAVVTNPEVDKGLIPKTAPIFKEADIASGAKYFKQDVTKSFDNEVVLSTKTWLRFKIGNDNYLVLKSNVRMAQYTVKKDVLFAEEPKVSDVEQGGLGDCYLLAAITSVVMKDPAKIKEMMKDNGNSVSVRMYDVDPSKKPITFTPRTITVEKSIAEINGSAIYARGALWVQILEKAYAAAGYTGDYDSQTGTFTMKNIAGGHAHMALGHLVGKEGTIINLEPKSLAAVPGGATPNLPPGVGEREWKLIKKNTEKMFSKGLGPSEVPFLFVESFEQYFASNAGKKHPFGVQKKVLDWISENGLYQHEAGTGRYTEEQKREFDSIVALLQAGRLVTLSSKQKIAEGSAGKGHSGGEDMMMGLAGGHAYTVLDYGYGDADNPQHVLPKGAKNDARWLKLRNPWGSYGRKYDWDPKAKRWVPKKAKSGKSEDTEALHETKGGMFWLELGDMTRNFRTVKMA